MTGDLLSSRYRSPLLITIDHPSTHKKLLLPSQLNLSSFSSGRRASFELNCRLISLSTDSLFSQIFKIVIALTPPRVKKNTARKFWLERNAISPNSSSYRLIAPRALVSVVHTRHKPLQMVPRCDFDRFHRPQILEIFVLLVWLVIRLIIIIIRFAVGRSKLPVS